MRPCRFLALAAAIGLTLSSTWVHATPYASGVTVTGGTSVQFILNEPADVLKYSINGGSFTNLDGTTKGTKSFLIPPGATFSIVADKTAATGFLIPTGGTVTPNTAGCAAANSCTGL